VRSPRPARHDHEARAKAILERNHPALFVSASHELSEEYREFERCSTVVANAFVGPRVQRYLTEIGERITGEGFQGTFLVVQSTGGLFELEKTLKYKNKQGRTFDERRGELLKLMTLIEGLDHASPRLRVKFNSACATWVSAR